MTGLYIKRLRILTSALGKQFFTLRTYDSYQQQQKMYILKKMYEPEHLPVCSAAETAFPLPL